MLKMETKVAYDNGDNVKDEILATTEKPARMYCQRFIFK